MSEKTVDTLSNSKIITVCVPKGGGKPILELLKENGVITATMYDARGASARSKRSRAGIPVMIMTDVINVVVPAEKADDIFHLLYTEAGISNPLSGFMFQGPLRNHVPFLLPDIEVSEEDKD